MRSKPFQNIEEVVAALEEKSGNDKDPADMIKIPPDVAKVSDKETTRQQKLMYPKVSRMILMAR